MIFNLPSHNLYGNSPIPIELPDDWDVEVSSYKGEKAPNLNYEQILEKINNPIGTRKISEDAKGCNNAVIIIDDITRPTPVAPIARVVIQELENAGISRDNIRFVVAVGGHRAMSREDNVRKLDEEIVKEFRVYSHNPFFNNVFLGKTSLGVPIELNADVVNADYKVGIGTIFAHSTTGVGGGAKLILPGIASIGTIRQFHSFPQGRWDINNSARKNTVEAAKMLGLNFTINALLNGKGEIAEIYSGHYNRIIEDNISKIKQFYSVKYAGKADLVIANNYFKPTESSLAYSNNYIFESVNDNGYVVISCNSPQGCAPHYVFGTWGDNGIGGIMYKGKRATPKHIKKYFAFSKYMDKGVSGSWHCADEKLVMTTEWSDIINGIENKPRKVIIYPYATVGYYDNM